MFLIRDKITEEIVRRIDKYPNKYNDEIIGFDYDLYEMFIVVEESKPKYDSKIEYLVKIEIFTNELHPFYEKVKICRVSWDKKEVNRQSIIDKLNQSLGDHLDTQYPLWERIKHAGEGNYILWNKSEDELTQEELDRKAYIDATYAWISDCRSERDKRQLEFLTNNVYPSFEWKNRPIK